MFEDRMIWAPPTWALGVVPLAVQFWREVLIALLVLGGLFLQASRVGLKADITRLEADAYAVQTVQRAAAERHEAAMDGAVAEGERARQTAAERAEAAVDAIGRAETCEEVLAALLEGTRIE